jgi:ribosomal protein S6--L-glutamate ligase
MFKRHAIALEGRLRRCRNVHTLGVRPNFRDYTTEERRLIEQAAVVYYPSMLYADLFHAAGKPTFPSLSTYRCAQDKIRQSTLFSLCGVSHPRTRFFYGRRQKESISSFFRFPFIGKVPRGSAMGRGVFLIRNRGELEAYCRRDHVAYIQEYVPAERDMRVIVIGGRVVHAYWRIAAPGEFRTNLALGGRVSLEPVPAEALALARTTAAQCGWNDVGIDICRHGGRLYVLEANMKYGKEGFRQAGIDYAALMEKMIDDATI